MSLNETPAAPTEVPVTKPDQDKQDIEASSTEKAPEPAAEQEHKQEEKETTKPKPAAKPPLVPEKELPVIEQELPKLSYKKTERLYEIRSILNKLLSNAEAMGEELSAKANEFKKTVAEKLEKNIEFQENIKQSTEALLESLKLALEEGNSESAIKSWDKIQGNISNTSNRIRENLQKQANAYKAKLTELRSWKTFASTEKKKEIITQMEHLIESRMHAADRSKHISNMHQEWKSLGRSNQNEQLWKTFKTLSDKAYEPCKEYFKQRKQQMVDNLKERRKICDQLEVEVKSLFPEKAQDEGSEKDVTAPPSADEIKTEPRGSVNITALNKLLSAAEKDWKHFAPIEQSKIKSLQKRFYGSVNQLRKLRKHAQSSSAKLKQDCVAAAQALITLEDNKKAMNEAKRLQQEWKKIGPTSYKEDNKYWAEFRAACDKIFEKRDQVSNELKQNLKQAEQDLAKILESLAAIFEVDDDSFRKSRNEYKDLSQEFSNALDPRLKQQRGRLLDRFNNLKRKIDSRYKTLPDKKQQQLKKAVMDRANFLEKIEIELLNTKDDSQFQEIRKQSRESAWEALESSGNAKLDSALADRFSNLSSTDSINSMRKLASSNESKFRLLCIQSEIRANIDTPSADQSQRMQLQLQQLQSGFGKSKPEPKENAKHAFGIELEAMCYGPIENAPLQELRQRLDNAVKKLL
ncbi:MAG: hypothetical protein COA96_14895 [SAR86 cluster bacterium]|uniref:DUF349 domain-containing protein n=1 Tax=SAR86 cluster bacterium TaxID=2030880 RepID=A0A2A5AS61_9GAMM|nr:MAG: hypothetical protein COA96_14895 [SAR86 cluster bacterium]